MEQLLPLILYRDLGFGLLVDFLLKYHKYAAGCGMSIIIKLPLTELFG